jgi:hypothetical protein
VLESLRQDHDHAATGASRMASRLDLIDSAVSALAATVAERKRAEPVGDATRDVEQLLTLLDTRESISELRPALLGMGSLLDLDGRATYESIRGVMTEAQGRRN